MIQNGIYVKNFTYWRYLSPTWWDWNITDVTSVASPCWSPTWSTVHRWPHWRRSRTCHAGHSRRQNWSLPPPSSGRGASGTAAVRPSRRNTCPTCRLCIPHKTCSPWSGTAGTPPGKSAVPRSAPNDDGRFSIF